MQEDSLSLSTLGRGAAIERFDDELERVLVNVLDPNTTLGAREITLKVKVTPTDNRDQCELQIVCTSKLAGPKPVNSIVYVGRDADGSISAGEFDPRQMRLDYEEQQRKQPSTLHRIAP